MYQHKTAINQEIGAWIREFRIQWMSPLKPSWDALLPRFLCALAGALTVFGTLYVNALLDRGYFLSDLATVLVSVFLFVVYLIAATWFAWLVSFRDFGYGPTRLYLSGVTLPGAVLLVLVNVIERMQ